MSHDLQGRPFAKVSEVKEGDTVRVDDGFTCIEPWTTHKVHKDHAGELFIPCKEIYHNLEGQRKNDYYVGIYKL